MKRAGSYFVAWSLSCLYLFATMASTVIVSKQIAGLASYRDPTYHPKAVHVWAINVGILLVCALINLFGIRAMHSIQTFSLVWFIVGFFVWLIVPLVKAKDTVGFTPAKEVFTSNLNLSGWGSFVAFMIGTAGVSAGYGIPDAVTHIAEETKRPEVDLPKIMVMSPLISLVTATAMCLSFLFCNVPQITMALSPTGVPFIDFLAATVHNRAGVTAMTVILIYSQFVACLECQLASSRTLFTFAREGGAFFPSILGRVNLTLQVPVWTVLFNFVFCAALTLLLLGSETALNVFLNCSGTLALCTYGPLFAASIFGGRKFYKGPFTLGRWGFIVNIIAAVYLMFFVVFWFFPYMKSWRGDNSMFSESSVTGPLVPWVRSVLCPVMRVGCTLARVASSFRSAPHTTPLSHPASSSRIPAPPPPRPRPQSSTLTSDYNIAIVPGVMLLGVVAWFVSGRRSYLTQRTLI